MPLLDCVLEKGFVGVQIARETIVRVVASQCSHNRDIAEGKGVGL